MKVIVCVDDNNGMMFNNRRQSRDRILIEDVVKNVIGGNLLMAPYSEPLFKDSNIDALAPAYSPPNGFPSPSTLIAYSVMMPEDPVLPGSLNTPSK